MEDDARTGPPAPSADTAADVARPAARTARPAARIVRLRAPTPRATVVIGGAVVLGVVLFAAGSAVRPFVVGLLLAYLLDPLVEWFARLGVWRWLAVLLVRPKLQGSADRALPPAWRSDAWAMVGIVHEVFGKWVRGQLVLGGVVGLASFIGLTVLGFYVDPIFGRFAVLLAIIAGLGELLPIIGPIISAIPAVLLGFTAGPGPALAAFLLYLAIQQLENNILVPKIQSDAIDLHPSVVIAALVIGGAIFGLLGAILALPVTAAFRDVFKYVFRRASEVGGEPLGAAGSSEADVAAMEAAGARFAQEAGADTPR